MKRPLPLPLLITLAIPVSLAGWFLLAMLLLGPAVAR